MNYRKGLEKKFICHQVCFGTPSNFVTFSSPVDQLFCSVLHKNGHTTYNEHFTAYKFMTFVCAGWLHKVQWDLQWVLCTAFWSMDMTGVYACQFEAVCDVTTVPSHLKKKVLSLLDSPVSGKNLLQIVLETLPSNYFSSFLSFLFAPFCVGPL